VPYKDPEKRKEMARKYVRAYAQRHPERVKQSTKAWRKKNWDKHLATAKRYRDKHPERVKASMQRVDALPHRVEARKRYLDRLNKSILHAWQKKWRIERSLRKNDNGGVCTLIQWQWRCELYGNCCAYCHSSLERKAEMDHVIPVAKGGTGWPSNLVPACRSCNARKNTKRWQPKLPKSKENHNDNDNDNHRF